MSAGRVAAVAGIGLAALAVGVVAGAVIAAWALRGVLSVASLAVA